jgi:riboflavin biosynthesis pyrimidine reductase
VSDVDEDQADRPKGNRSKEIHVPAPTDPDPGAESAAAHPSAGAVRRSADRAGDTLNDAFRDGRQGRPVTELERIGAGAAVEDHGYRPAPEGLRANMIFSADGAAGFQGRAGPLSCPSDQRLLMALRAYADVVLVGAGTARAERYGPVRLLPDQRAQRIALGLSEHPPPIAVVSQSGQLPETMFGSTPPILITTARSARENTAIQETPCQVLVCGEDSVDIAEALTQLRDRGLPRVLCEGGPTLLDGRRR